MDPAGFVDDQYWQGTGKVSVDKQARLNDPGNAGYGNNKVEGVLCPIMLTASVDAVVKGALFQSKAVIYTKAVDDTVPEGSVVPVFKGSHFPNFDKNGDGFIEPLEAPEGETAY